MQPHYRSLRAFNSLCATLLMAPVSVYAALPNGVSTGDVTTDSAVLWARTTALGGIEFTVLEVDRHVRVIEHTTVNVGDSDVPAKITLRGLRPGTYYAYQVKDAEGARRFATFRTADAPGRSRGLRFGASGDWRGELAPYPAIANAWRRRLDFFVKLGDTIYADVPSPAVNKPQAESLTEFRRKHAEGYATRFGLNTWTRLQAVTPIYALIDDHEVTNDFAGGALAASDPRFGAAMGLINETTLYRRGMQAFTEYNAIEAQRYPALGDTRTDGRPDLYRAQRFGDVAALFMLDARSFRDQELPPVQNPLDPAQIGLFLVRAFDPARTLLSQRQLQHLLTDMLAAHHAGVRWKFVFVPEPIQNLGVIGASDRFEGYAAERTTILKFIDEHQISNVVFVSADIHGTLVNNLSYQLSPQHPPVATRAFEITTGSVAYDAPFGPTVLRIAAGIPVAPGVSLLDVFLQTVGTPTLDAFNALAEPVKNNALEAFVNQQLIPLGYDPLGLEATGLINAALTTGTYTAVFNFGWTEFDINPFTQALRVTTFGVDPYTQAELESNPDAVTNRTPRLISQFVVTPQ